MRISSWREFNASKNTALIPINSGIYCAFIFIGGKRELFYIGSSIGLRMRISSHLSEWGRLPDITVKYKVIANVNHMNWKLFQRKHLLPLEYKLIHRLQPSGNQRGVTC